MRAVAEQAAGFGPFDAVVHNVAVGYREARRVETEDGFTELWAINVLAPYVLTALIPRPPRLVYLSSGMHLGAQDTDLEDPRSSGAPVPPMRVGTQAWLAVDRAAAGMSGEYLYHREPARLHPDTADPVRQDRLLSICEEASGLSLPA